MCQVTEEEKRSAMPIILDGTELELLTDRKGPDHTYEEVVEILKKV